jgi:signal transduction histidine kinase
MDQAEALAPIIAFRNSIALTGIATLIVASAIAIGLARSITRPIRDLQSGAERLGRGERDILLPERSQDELGVLAREFNKLARSLADSEVELRQRAVELEAVNAKLEQANGGLERENAERRRAEDEVRALNDELEQRVATRTAELGTVNRELESFAYSVSHDLRAPLRHMDGFSQALLEDYGDQLDEAAKRLLGRIRNGSVRMGRLIDDLLRLSRVSRGELEREPVDLSAMARRIVSELQQGEPAREIAVDIAPNLESQGDPRLIEIALQNLLGNAWKFTGKNPNAKIAFGMTRQDGRSTYFVRDNGVGFDMAYVGKLFAPFQRLHTTDEFAGTGIGLVTVARVVHRHGGEVWIESAIDKGTIVRFTV